MTKPHHIDVAPFRVHSRDPLDLKAFATEVDVLGNGGPTAQEALQGHVEALSELQGKFYAADSCALLVILQGMDAAGKDGAIRHVMTGVNPQGCQVVSFKQPSPEELRHDFLWRGVSALPSRGMIGIFNRSWYEEVLIVRVHSELLKAEGFTPDDARPRLWKQRYRSIRQLEAHLGRNRTRIVKIFLHLSKPEQKRRFLARIDDPTKNWKLSPSDIEERRFWGRYQRAYAKAISATAAKDAPWWIVPADHKPSARLIVSQILLDVLREIDPEWPHVTPEQRVRLEEIRQSLA